jgi:hypothetical protein
MNPSPPSFPKLLAMTIVEILIMGSFCGGHGPRSSGAHGGLGDIIL